MVGDASVVVSNLVPHDVHALRLVPMDAALARVAADLAGRLRLRGADAVYIATAATLRLPLVTWDVEQRQRAARVIEVVAPEVAR